MQYDHNTVETDQAGVLSSMTVILLKGDQAGVRCSVTVILL